ncbi:MinD/ParA family ATP-binding protein [Halorubrum sp. DTA46]|uniref:MinD/ParA family ATP-binding protein n=1 Tax=Halorubrum sp. DTA46 TaxID=3402162 RepID=UPI003AAFDA01
MIAVAGGKGGSGKTTTSVGLARALSRRGAPVVVADADWDLPNTARLATATRDGDRSSAPTEERTVLDAVRDEGRLSPARSAPTVLAAPATPRRVDAQSVFQSLDETIPDDTPTLLDCPAGASPDAVAPLRDADRCLLVTPLDRAALRDATKTAAIARRLDCRPLGVVAVRAESVPEAVGELLGCPVLGRIPAAAPDPLSAPRVRSAYDRVAEALVDRYGADRWRIA